MPTYNVSTGFTGVDNVTPKFVRMGKSAAAAGKKMKGAFNGINKGGSIVGGNLAAMGISRGIGMVTSKISELVTEYASFDDAIVSSGAKFKDVNLTTAEGQKQLEKLRKTAKLAGQESIFTTTESAKGLEFLAMAGFTSAQAMESLNTIQNLAIATNSDFAQAADMSSDLLGAFGLAAEDAVQNATNFERLNDVLTKTANSANVSLSDMFETMKVAGPIAQAYGSSLEEVAAITGVMGNAGIKGSMGATALKNIMLRMAAPTAASAAVMDELKIKTDDAAGNMRKITDILAEVGEKTSKLGSKKKLEAMNALFGKIPIAAASNLANSIGSIRELEKALLSAGGTAQKTAEQMSKSLGNRLKSLGSAVEAFAFKFFDAFAVQGADGLTPLTNAIKSFDVKPVVEGLKIAFNVIGALIPVMKIVLPLWLLWTAYQWGLNIALNANPIGLIIAGITALIVVVVLVIQHWKFLTDTITGVNSKFRGIINIIAFLLGPLGMIIKAVITMTAIFNAFRNGGFLAGIKAIGLALFNGIVTPLEMILTLMSKIPGFKGAGNLGLESIANLRETLFSVDQKVEAPNAGAESSKRNQDKLSIELNNKSTLDASIETDTIGGTNINEMGVN